MSDANGQWTTLSSIKTNWNANEWYHVSIVIDPLNGTKMYIDGQVDNTNTNMTAAIQATYNNNIIAIGNWGGNINIGRSWFGSIDRVMLSSSPMHNNNFLHKDAPIMACNQSILAYYRMNDNTTNTISDLSGNNNHGNIQYQSFSPGVHYTYSRLNSQELGNAIEISPNPSNGLISIKNITFDNAEIVIYNTSGQKVKEITNLSNLQINNIDISMLRKGVYFISINDKNSQSREVKKIIIH
jgi:hypothetical protein